MFVEVDPWPYLPLLARLALARAIGLFIGIERERRHKGAGVRTFAFAAMLGAVGGLLGPAFGLLAVSLLGALVVLLNIDTIRSGDGAQLTTSAALLVTAFSGLLAGQGHTFTPTLLGIVTTALLAWKQPLTGFSEALTESELRSAILLAILAFVVYPILSTGSLDPWQLILPRQAWITVILIAALGFCNYVLLKLYGARGLEFTGFLGGLVNSTVTVTELASRLRASHGQLSTIAFRGVMLATLAKHLAPEGQRVKVGTIGMLVFARMLAKIAHAYAVAHIGLDQFRPFLPDLILGRSTTAPYVVGGDPRPLETETNTLHHVYRQDCLREGVNYVLVAIQLFAFLGMPRYHVVAGERHGWIRR